MARYEDDEIVDLIDRAGAQGDDLDLLYSALWYSSGTRGLERLREVAADDARAYRRALAVTTLARRVGPEANATYVDALQDRSLEVQCQAAIALAEHGDRAAWPAFFDWLVHRFASPRDSRVWDPVELACAARYADRWGLDAEIRKLLTDQWGNLAVDEKARVIAVSANALHSAAGNTDFSEVDVRALGDADVFGRSVFYGPLEEEDTDPMLDLIEQALARVRSRVRAQE